MSTVFSSVLNFNILGLLQRLHHLNIQAMLQVDAEKSGIRFLMQKSILRNLVQNHTGARLAIRKLARQLRMR